MEKIEIMKGASGVCVALISNHQHQWITAFSYGRSNERHVFIFGFLWRNVDKVERLQCMFRLMAMVGLD